MLTTLHSVSLFSGTEAGYIERHGFTRSTGEKARGHVLVVWRRTRKAIPAHVCEVSAA